MNTLEKIFKVKKPIIGMLHLDYLEGKKFKGVNHVIQKALTDIDSLQNGEVDGILVENWMHDEIGEFVSSEAAKKFTKVVQELSKHIKIPFGINVLNNDYRVALSVAKLTDASFVQLDVFIDHVRSNFVHSPKASKKPFEIKIDPEEIVSYAESIEAETIPLFVFIQPKHYLMLEKGKSIEESAKQAIAAGASALIVTKETGMAPMLGLVQKVKKVAGETPVGIGSGFNSENATDFLKVVDFAIVGTALKVDQVTDNPVDLKRVKKLMKIVKDFRGFDKKEG